MQMLAALFQRRSTNLLLAFGPIIYVAWICSGDHISAINSFSL